jgi:hypothetical protein
MSATQKFRCGDARFFVYVRNGQTFVTVFAAMSRILQGGVISDADYHQLYNTPAFRRTWQYRGLRNPDTEAIAILGDLCSLPSLDSPDPLRKEYHFAAHIRRARRVFANPAARLNDDINF